MANNALTFTLTPGMAPAAPLMRLLGRYHRQKIEAFTEISIALLDLWDGDAEAEDYGDAEDDDPDHALDEGEPNFVAVSDGGAGCLSPIRAVASMTVVRPTTAIERKP